MNLYLGIDFGTSGARAVVIDADSLIHAQAQYSFGELQPQDWTASWETALLSLIERIPKELRRVVRAIALNGTSSTVLLCDAQGTPVNTPMLYNDARGACMLGVLQEIAPPHHTVISATSSLAKLLWLTERRQSVAGYEQIEKSEEGMGKQRNRYSTANPFSETPDESVVSNPLYFLHQADWLSFLLHGRLGVSDYHNSLKLGYDVRELSYPDWLSNMAIAPLLPVVLAPGAPIGTVKPEISDRFGFPSRCLVCAGTTDSIAAFLASGARSPGEAVTSLGSTLVLKLLSRNRVDDARYGIYSHRLGDLWLVGGASNTGGAVLRQFFSDAELQNLSAQIPLEQESFLDYYPLLKPGERFPLNDPDLSPRLTPQPSNRVEFLHGLLESMARIEAKGYRLLQELGATSLTQVYTAGGGANNAVWGKIRSRHLQVPVVQSTYTEAAYGTALLAMQGSRS